MWNLKSIIYSLFGAYEKETDTFKDVNGKGVQERFNESIAEDFDETTLPLIVRISDNTRNPILAYADFIPLLESDRGIELLAGLTEEQRRRMIRFSLAIVEKKGTKAAYDLIFRYIGFTVDALTEDFTGQTFDSPITFDSGNQLDSGGCGCTYYDLELSGALPITQDLYNFFLKAISFIEPVTIKLRDLSVGGSVITPFYPLMLWSNNPGSVTLLFNGEVGKVVNIDWVAPTTGFIPSIQNEYALNSPAVVGFIGDALRRHDIYFKDETTITEIIAPSQELRKGANLGIFSALTRVEFQDNQMIDTLLFGKFANNDGLWVDLSFNVFTHNKIWAIMISASINIQTEGGGNSQVIWLHNQQEEFSTGVKEDQELALSVALELISGGCYPVYSYFTIKEG